MTKLEAIAKSKTFRKEADELLQRMKAHTKDITAREVGFSDLVDILDAREVIAQHILSTRDLESCIMRQGMALKYIGAPNPYPESKNPESPVVEPTADGLKM